MVQMASAQDAVHQLQHMLGTLKDRRSFVFKPRAEENVHLPPHFHYSPTSTRIWDFQMLLRTSQESAGCTRTFPTTQHRLARFDDHNGVKSEHLIDDSNLKHLLRSSLQEDVANAIEQFERFAIDTEITITSDLRIRAMTSVFLSCVSRFLAQFPALKQFGSLELINRESSIVYPDADTEIDHEGSLLIPAHAEGSFTARFRAPHQQHDNLNPVNEFGLLSLKVKNATHKITPGLHLSGNCRPGTSDERVAKNIAINLPRQVVEHAIKNFKHTATDVLEAAILNKCRLIGLLDPGGLCLMMIDHVQGTGSELDVKYSHVFCTHNEDGTFWYQLLCAIVNQLYREFPQLRDCLDERTAYRKVVRNPATHKQAHELYSRFCVFHAAAAKERIQLLLHTFDSRLHKNRALSNYKILKVFRKPAVEYPTSVFHVVHRDINNGQQSVVVKLQRVDCHGERLFKNELSVYLHLMRIGRRWDPQHWIWPLLLEYGVMTMAGQPHYYLCLEYIDGDRASYHEAEECSKRLLSQARTFHNDVKPANFIRLRGTDTIKAVDFGLSRVA